MVDMTAEQIAQRALDLNLLDQRQLASIWTHCGTHHVPVDEFRDLLVRRELMTNYQMDRLMRGERTGFFYGDYKVLYLVGTGSFARVYRAVHKGDGRVVAVKVLRKRFSDSSTQTGQFLREGKMGAALRHPNIVPIHEVHSIRHVFFLVMDFVEGQSLRDFVKIRKKLEPLEASEIMSGVMSGLVYAAKEGITHRDLKLSNVLISSDGCPHLVDFGLAAAQGSGDDTTNPRTIDYAGLERATGVRKDDPRSDIYFAGCIFYHMMTGVPPLSETRDRVQRLSVNRFKDVVPIRQHLPEIPFAVETIVERSMHLDANERYAKPVEMLLDLGKAVKSMKNDAALNNNVVSGDDTDAPRTNTVMLVESNSTVQDAMRTGLKKNGYRVLVISDPERAYRRFLDDSNCADCVIVSTIELGSVALELFNRFGANQVTSHIPLILLLGKKQSQLHSAAQLSEARVAVTMPVRMSQLTAALENLLASKSSRSS